MNVRNILVAEDDDADALLLQHAFRKAAVPARMEFATDGLCVVAALEKLLEKASLPDLLVLDLKMPRMNGFEVMEWLRKRSSYRDLRIVVLSSSDDPRDICKASELGASHYLVKPNNPRELVEVARRLGEYLNHSESVERMMA